MGIPKKCPLCHAAAISQSVVTSHVYGREGQDHAFFYCKNCDVRYQYPRLTSEEEEHFYSAEFERFMENRAGEAGGWHKAENHINANKSNHQRRMKYLDPVLTGSKSVLEVGCSSGFMLYPLAESGYLCTGIEPSGVFSEFVRKNGIPVFDSLKQLQDLNPGTLFDVIMHYFVLEHIDDPVKFIKTQLDLLNPGGKIVFEIPNAADPLYSVYDIPAFERFYWSVAHPWYYSEKSLHYLLTKIGHPYTIMRDQRYDLSNHIIWARDGKPGGLGRFTNVLGSELEDNYKKALISCGKCDTLVAVINKK